MYARIIPQVFLEHSWLSPYKTFQLFGKSPAFRGHVSEIDEELDYFIIQPAPELRLADNEVHALKEAVINGHFDLHIGDEVEFGLVRKQLLASWVRRVSHGHH